MSVLFKVFKELEDEWRVQFLDGDIASPLVSALMRESQQRSETVTVGRHSAWACASLLKQTFREEFLQQDWKGLRC
ncbi:hypothetical protein [Paraburkholderia atlantica]|uniref:hypothetical protein n=1 Tax=Paraburkholderia atlantica TaxID=2654982 RepID=UPI0001BF4149